MYLSIQQFEMISDRSVRRAFDSLRDVTIILPHKDYFDCLCLATDIMSDDQVAPTVAENTEVPVEQPTSMMTDEEQATNGDVVRGTRILHSGIKT